MSIKNASPKKNRKSAPANEKMNNQWDIGPFMPYPNGFKNNPIELIFSVTQDGRSLPGVRVDFEVIPVRPDQAWRKIENLATLYQGKPKTFKTIKAQIAKGSTLLLGRLEQPSAITDASGQVIAKYFPSSIGPASNEINPAIELVRAKSVAGVLDRTEVRIAIGAELVPIPQVANALKLKPNAEGKYVSMPLAYTLNSLAQYVIGMKWKWPIVITDASRRWGGLFPPHLEHRFGYTCDLRPMSTDGEPTAVGKPNYDRERSKELVTILKAMGAANILFNDPTIPEAKHETGHENHMHVVFNKEIPFLDQKYAQRAAHMVFRESGKWLAASALNLRTALSYTGFFDYSDNPVAAVSLSLSREEQLLTIDSSSYTFDKFGAAQPTRSRQATYQIELEKLADSPDEQATIFAAGITDVRYNGPGFHVCMIYGEAGEVIGGRLIVIDQRHTEVLNVIELTSF